MTPFGFLSKIMIERSHFFWWPSCWKFAKRAEFELLMYFFNNNIKHFSNFSSWKSLNSFVFAKKFAFFNSFHYWIRQFFHRRIYKNFMVKNNVKFQPFISFYKSNKFSLTRTYTHQKTTCAFAHRAACIFMGWRSVVRAASANALTCANHTCSNVGCGL